MSELLAIQKQLKIKTGVVQRYEKEGGFYRKEVEDLRKKLGKLESDKAEEWDIKNATRMVEESEKMVLDTDTKLDKAIGELGDLIKQVEEKPGVMDTEEFKNAQKISKKT